MPEAAEVAIFADGLRNAARKTYIAGLYYDEKSKYAKIGMKNINAFDALLPLRILDIQSKGKKIVFSLENGVYLLSGLGMEGRWDKCDPEDVVPNEKHSNLWLSIVSSAVKRSTPSGPAAKKTTEKKCDFYLFYTDVVHYGHFTICLNDKELQHEMRKVGKDILKEEITREYFIQSYRLKKNLKKPVCEIMLDQEKIAGIGNWLRAEILYMAKIDPWRTVGQLSDDELDLIRQCAVAIVNEAYEKKGATLNSYKDFEGQRGSYIVKVYGKEEDPHVQSRQDKQKRMMWWDDSVQK